VINNPVLFSSLALVDPVVLPPPPPGKFESWAEAFRFLPTLDTFVDGAPGEVSGNPSSLCFVSSSDVKCVLTGKFRAHALEMLKKIPWFAAWDPLALEIYVDCQMYEDKNTGETKLKTAGVWVGILPPPALGTK